MSLSYLWEGDPVRDVIRLDAAVKANTVLVSLRPNDDVRDIEDLVNVGGIYQVEVGHYAEIVVISGWGENKYTAKRGIWGTDAIPHDAGVLVLPVKACTRGGRWDSWMKMG